jgi:hypothetical protein
MAGRGSGSLTGWWHDIKTRASEAVTAKEADFARGKVAGVAVTDDAGNVLIEPGHRIDDEAIARARQAGKMTALAAAAVKAQTQDLKERVGTQYARTDSGREKLYLESVEEYREARTYLRRILTMDVTDIRGNVIVPAGKALDDEDIRRARDEGLLSALLVAAEQSLPPAPETPASAPPAAAGAPFPPPAAPRPAPLLLNPDEAEPLQK